MITCIAVDDEPLALRQIVSYIDQTPNLKLVGKFSNALMVTQFLKENPVDLLFLDINMPDLNGIELAKLIENPPRIIFTTAYSQYAIDGYKVNAVDYLLKPIDRKELKKATSKAMSLLNEQNINTQLQDLKKAFNQLALNKIALEIPKGVIFISHDDIVLFEADGMYTKTYLENGDTQLICKPLKHFVEQLKNLPIFYKPHRSYLINLKHIRELSKKDGHHLVMTNNKTIPISKDKRDEFMLVLSEVFNT